MHRARLPLLGQSRASLGTRACPHRRRTLRDAGAASPSHNFLPAVQTRPAGTQACTSCTPLADGQARPRHMHRSAPCTQHTTHTTHHGQMAHLSFAEPQTHRTRTARIETAAIHDCQIWGQGRGPPTNREQPHAARGCRRVPRAQQQGNVALPQEPNPRPGQSPCLSDLLSDHCHWNRHLGV